MRIVAINVVAKCNGCITVVKYKTAGSRRKAGGGITAVKYKTAKSRRNLPAGVHKEPAFGQRFSNRAANSISRRRTTDFLRPTGALVHCGSLRPFALRRLHLPQRTSLAFPYSASAPTSCRTPKHPDTLLRAASSTNRNYAFYDYFAEEKPAAQGRVSGRHCRRRRRADEARLDGVSHDCYTV